MAEYRITNVSCNGYLEIEYETVFKKGPAAKNKLEDPDGDLTTNRGQWYYWHEPLSDEYIPYPFKNNEGMKAGVSKILLKTWNNILQQPEFPGDQRCAGMGIKKEGEK